MINKKDEQNHFKTMQCKLAAECIDSFDKEKFNEFAGTFDWQDLRLRVCDHRLEYPAIEFRAWDKDAEESYEFEADNVILFLRWKRPWHRRARGLDYADASLN